MDMILLFRACLVNSQNYAPRCRGQLNALLPEATMHRTIVHCPVHGNDGHSIDYSVKQPLSHRAPSVFIKHSGTVKEEEVT